MLYLIFFIFFNLFLVSDSKPMEKIIVFPVSDDAFSAWLKAFESADGSIKSKFKKMMETNLSPLGALETKRIEKGFGKAMSSFKDYFKQTHIFSPSFIILLEQIRDDLINQGEGRKANVQHLSELIDGTIKQTVFNAVLEYAKTQKQVVPQPLQSVAQKPTLQLVAPPQVLPIVVQSPRGEERSIRELNDLVEAFYKQRANGYSFQRLVLVDSPQNIKLFINLRFHDGETVTHIAAFQNDLKTLEFLFSHNADLEVKNKRFETPLIYAAQSTLTNKKIIKWFYLRNVEMDYEAVGVIEPKTRFDKSSIDGNSSFKTALKAAAESNNVDVIRALGEIGVKDKADYSEKALSIAAKCNNYEAVNVLLELYLYDYENPKIDYTASVYSASQLTAASTLSTSSQIIGLFKEKKNVINLKRWMGTGQNAGNILVALVSLYILWNYGFNLVTTPVIVVSFVIWNKFGVYLLEGVLLKHDIHNRFGKR